MTATSPLVLMKPLFMSFFILNSVLIAVEARPFNIMSNDVSSENKWAWVGDFFDGLGQLGAMKESGPSPGVGHAFKDARTQLGGIKGGLGSPHVGHSFGDFRTQLGGAKDGPSPGQGHKFVEFDTLGGIKDGPSPGVGHAVITGDHQ